MPAQAEPYAASIGVAFTVVGVLHGNSGAFEAHWQAGLTEYDSG